MLMVSVSGSNASLTMLLYHMRRKAVHDSYAQSPLHPPHLVEFLFPPSPLCHSSQQSCLRPFERIRWL